ncbi:TonB-dependent receptor [Pinirhizobacter soli]|uniref:TonB-dependent receptor n=1 Tax=Pinirhizobacter soli TaxID=2786953 RepID=UPI002029F73C|nr:TonB-dependent receptor [Pinirhizobacter soli]
MDHRCLSHALAVRPFRLRPRPLAAACATALLLSSIAPGVLAQDTTQPPPANDSSTQATTPAGQTPAKADNDKKNQKKSEDSVSQLDAVIVTGIQASIQSSQRAKENSNSIIEAISAEDIGKLPDSSIAESLSRLPGLATQRVAGRADMISIRGTSPDFTGTTLNGREQATIGENRGVEFDQYPSELISGAAVYKTPDATLIGQGLSGTVDLHTIKPLDLPKQTIALNVRGEHTTNGELNPSSGVNTWGHRASFSYIDQFFDHTLGVAVGVAQLDSPIQERQYQAWWWANNNGPDGAEGIWGAPHTPGLPEGVISQEGMQLRARSERQLRNGLMTVIEWAPGDSYHSTLDLYYSTFNQRQITNGLQWSSSPYDNVSYSDVGVTPKQPYPIVTSGVISGLKPIMQNEYNKEHDKLFSAGWNNQYDFGNGWQGTADLSYSSAKVNLHDAYLFTGLPGGATTTSAFSNHADNGYPYFTPGTDFTNPANVAFTDPDNYGYNGREEFDKQKDTIKAIRLEMSHPLGWIFSTVDFGVDYSDRKKTKTADVSFVFLNGNGNGVDAPYDHDFSTPINPSVLYNPSYIGYGGVPGIVNYDVLDALRSQFYLVPRNGAGDYSRNYTIEEKVPVAYARFNIDTTLGDIPLGGNVGLQAVRTDQSSDALQTNNSGDLVGHISGGTKYNKFLPSLNLKAEIGERQYLRFGFAKTMTRGRIDDEKVASSAYVYQVLDGPQAGQVAWTGSGGNPKLKPYVAVGTDLSWEKYFGKASFLGAAVFHKNLLNYIYNKTVLDHDFSNNINDTPTLVPTSNIGSYTLPENGTGGKMDGVELSWNLEGALAAQALDGFGVQGNFSLTNSSIPVSSVSSIPGGPKTLPGLSRKVANLALYYEKYGFSVRVAERYRSAFTGEAVALFDQLGYQQVLADKQTDVQLGYAFDQGRWSGLSILLQVVNATNSPYKTVQISGLPNGTQVMRPLDFNSWGRTVMFGVNYKL